VTRCLIALGSNLRHGEFGPPRKVIEAATCALGDIGPVRQQSQIIATLPVGPSKRRFANAAAIVESELAPAQMLALLKHIERRFGRRRGQRWGARVLDLDIVLWSGGIWVSQDLAVPHPQFRSRDFVLGPASTLAPGWRDPVSGLSLRQLNARLTKPKPLPR